MIVGRRTYPLDIPHEPGNRIIIRDLSGLEMDDAREKNSQRTLRRYADMGDVLQTLRNQNQQDQESIENQVRDIDQKTLYDWEYLLVHAITAWEGPNYNDVECNSENKLLLDKVTLEWLIEEIVNRNTVPAGE